MHGCRQIILALISIVCLSGVCAAEDSPSRQDLVQLLKAAFTSVTCTDTAQTDLQSEWQIRTGSFWTESNAFTIAEKTLVRVQPFDSPKNVSESAILKT